MKVYRIKFIENSEIDCGLYGSSWEKTEGILDEVYASEKAAFAHIPEDVNGVYHTIEYQVITQELIEK